MKIEEILDEIETMILDAARLPFTNKRVLEEDDIARLLDELRAALPEEITEARRILAERQRIMDEAQNEGQKIVGQAKNYVAKLTDENIITQQAREQAKEIISNAENTAHGLRNDAVAYADDVFSHLEANVEKALEIIRSGHNSLRQQGREPK